MYPNSPHVDEPTMTDLRGILPGQRPPVDATVLDEPTSEVPIIKPAGVVDAEPEPEAAVTEPAVDAEETEPTAEVEPTAEIDLAVDAEPAAEAEYAEYAEPADADAAEPVAETDLAAEAVAPAADLITEDEPVTEDEPEPMTAAVEPVEAAPEPVATPPVVPVFDDDPSAEPPASPTSEWAKMSWTPAPPPGLVPAAPSGLFEPAPRPTEPEPVETEPVAEHVVISEIPEVTEPEVTEPEAVEPEVAEPEAVEPGVTEPEPAPRAPGELTETAIELWTDEATQRLRDEWRELQVQFIDDPQVAVNGAKSLVTSAVHELADTLLAAHDALDPSRDGERVDTETLRVAMRRYREFLDRVLAL